MGTDLLFATVDVFTSVLFAGNPLAIVNIPSNISLTQEQKQKIAREFNYSETVFLHEHTGSADGRRIDIFTTTEELPFAARMIEESFGEDPATGSAACGLAAYLALKDGLEDGEYAFEIEQGWEMGRRSEIGVRVKLDAVGKGVDRVELEGKAVLVMQGSIEV